MNMTVQLIQQWPNGQPVSSQADEPMIESNELSHITVQSLRQFNQTHTLT